MDFPLKEISRMDLVQTTSQHSPILTATCQGVISPDSGMFFRYIEGTFTKKSSCTLETILNHWYWIHSSCGVWFWHGKKVLIQIDPLVGRKRFLWSESQRNSKGRKTYGLPNREKKPQQANKEIEHY